MKENSSFVLCSIISFLGALSVLVLTFPILLIFLLLVYVNDLNNPIYKSKRVGKNCKEFIFYKIRSMVVNNNKLYFNTTSRDDPRITPIGQVVRLLKIDELLQFFNVLMGDIDIVGPRAQIVEEIAYYTNQEKELLKFKPGITDFSSIIFFDLNAIIAQYSDPNIAYHQLIRPWKNRLALFYLKNKSWKTDLKLIILTFIAFLSKTNAKRLVYFMLKKLKAKKAFLLLSLNKIPLKPYAPLGLNRVFTGKDFYR